MKELMRFKPKSAVAGLMFALAAAIPGNAIRRLACLGLAVAMLAGLTVSAATLYVWPDSPNPMPPYDSWGNAAANIQDAVDAAQPGDLVLVTNGVYATGGRVISDVTTNRVAIDKEITVSSVNGPAVTVIEGATGIRCAYVGTNAVLNGFTLTHGEAVNGDTNEGGGAWCESSAMLTNCIVTGNFAIDGGGMYGGTLDNCTLSENRASSGGGAYDSTLNNCTLSANDAVYGGGAYDSTLYSCTLTNNMVFTVPGFGGGWYGGIGGGVYGGTLYNCLLSGNSAIARGGGGGPIVLPTIGGYCGGAYQAVLYNCTLTSNSGGGADECTLYNSVLTGNSGGGAFDGTLYNCTVRDNSGPGVSGSTVFNCIVYFNTGNTGNYSDSTFNYSCTTPLPTNGVGNISADPQMATLTHLCTSSPCIAAGNSAYASGVDIDGEPWANPPCMGADQLTPGQANGPLTMSIEAEYTNVAPGIAIRFLAQNQGSILSSVWDFDDGTFVTNQPITSHTWSAPGNYNVQLTGYNDSFPDGVSATVQIEVPEGVYYVNQANPTSAYPYTSWATAATSIQDALEAKRPIGALVLVTNGVFASGSVATNGTNRIALTYPVEVRSVNGPAATVIEGAAGVRCAYVGTNAILSGFTLTSGNASTGGGAWCEDSATLTNCIVTDNTATNSGGGVYGGTLYNCTLTGNSAGGGGGVYGGTLYNCTLIGNSAGGGGGVLRGALYNCIVYFNSASIGPNYEGFVGYVPHLMAYCCTTPLPYGPGNITNAPLFVNTNGWSDLHLRYGSPGIDAGTNLSAILSTDLDGNPRPLDGDGDGIAAFDMGAYEFDARSLIPSDWFTSHGLDPSDPQVVSGNPDGDAFTTFQEWLAGTDPTNASSFFHIEDISKHSPATVSFESSTNRTYTLWSTPQLAPADWTPVPGEQAIPGNGGTLTLSVPTNAPQQFYRVEVNLP